MSEIDWSEAPGGATHCIPPVRLGDRVTWYKRNSARDWMVWSRYDSDQPMRWCTSVGTCDGGQFVARPVWDGEAWPVAVGAEVINGCGERRTVIAHDRGNIICRCEEQKDSYRAYSGTEARRMQLRPARTQKEIEREDLELLLSDCRTKTVREAAETMQAAGWRKVKA